VDSGKILRQNKLFLRLTSDILQFVRNVIVKSFQTIIQMMPHSMTAKVVIFYVFVLAVHLKKSREQCFLLRCHCIKALKCLQKPGSDKLIGIPLLS